MVFVKAEQSALMWVFCLAWLLDIPKYKEKDICIYIYVYIYIYFFKEVFPITQLKLEVGKGKYYQTLRICSNSLSSFYNFVVLFKVMIDHWRSTHKNFTFNYIFFDFRNSSGQSFEFKESKSLFAPETILIENPSGTCIKSLEYHYLMTFMFWTKIWVDIQFETTKCL